MSADTAICRLLPFDKSFYVKMFSDRRCAASRTRHGKIHFRRILCLRLLYHIILPNKTQSHTFSLNPLLKPPPRLLHRGSALFFRLFRRSQLRTIFVNKFPYTVKIRNYLCRMPLAQFKLYFISVNIICYIVCAFPTNAQWNHIAIIYK